MHVWMDGCMCACVDGWVHVCMCVGGWMHVCMCVGGCVKVFTVYFPARNTLI